MALFYCVKIAYLLILWNGPFVQAEQTASHDKILHRRASGPTQYDIRNVYLEPYEDLESNIMPTEFICRDSIYLKYQNDYSTLEEIELTKEQLDELFYSLLFGTVTRFMIEMMGITQTFISVKNFPDGMRYNLESNYVDYKPKFLTGNKLNLGICRREKFTFNYKFIVTDNRETIPPLKDLIENPIPLKPLGSGPYDIRNVYLEPFEDLKKLNFYFTNVLCMTSIYSQHVNGNPSLHKIELTNGQLEELFYDLLLHLAGKFTDYFEDWSLSVKNFPDGIRYNLESKFEPENRKMLEGNFLNLKVCREEKEYFRFIMIFTQNHVPIPPLIELTKTTTISTSTSQSTASQVNTFPTKMTTFQTKIPPVQTFPTEMTTSQTKESPVQTFLIKSTTVQSKESSVQTFSTEMTTSQTKESPVYTFPTKKTTIEVTQSSLKTTSTDPPIIQDCSVDMFVKRKMTTLTENAFSKNDWIPALHIYNKVDRPSCLSKPTPQLSTTCLCTVNQDLKTWVCEDQNFKAKEAVLDCSWNDFFTALKYYREVFNICVELALIIE